jgi:protein-serine/threonine kinase
VLEAPDAASAIVDHARINAVDHLVLGARGHSTLRRYLGSVSSEVVARAPCTVTVVRARPPGGGTGGAEPAPEP